MKKPEPAPAEANPFRRAVFMVPILRTWLPLPLGTEKNPTMTLKFKKNCLDIGVHYNEADFTKKMEGKLKPRVNRMNVTIAFLAGVIAGMTIQLFFK